MENKHIAKELESIHRKLDLLVSQMEVQQRKQQEMEDLKNDLMIIGKDAFQTAVMELEEIAPHFQTTDLVHLLKNLLRNIRNLTRMMEQMEGLIDFMDDLKPLSKNMFGEVMEKFNTLDRKGYFDFMREAAAILDTIVTTFSTEDIRLLRENITSILLTVKNLTQPDMLSTMNNAVGFYKKMDIEVTEDVSFRKIIQELKDPEVKRGLVFMLEFVKNMAAPNGAHINGNNQNH